MRWLTSGFGVLDEAQCGNIVLVACKAVEKGVNFTAE